MWMRGGTSKGGVFLAHDLPSDPEERDRFLLAVMGSPDLRQVDGLGGADPLTSKVAVVSPSSTPGVDIDYLFLQVFVDRALVSDAQNCGNMLAAVGPFAIERGLVTARSEHTPVVIRMLNTGQTAVATVETPLGRVTYAGAVAIDGVPGSAAGIPLLFRDIAGSSCGALLPTGNVVDIVAGVEVTLIDNGMPCVVIRASDVGVTGYETRDELDADVELKERLEAIRLEAGPMMNLGDVARQSVPKMMLVAPPRSGGAVSVRSFIPHRCHASVGVLGAVTAATCALIEGTPAHAVSATTGRGGDVIGIEHPTGITECVVTRDAAGQVVEAGMMRTARKLFDGEVFGR